MPLKMSFNLYANFCSSSNQPSFSPLLKNVWKLIRTLSCISSTVNKRLDLGNLGLKHSIDIISEISVVDKAKVFTPFISHIKTHALCKPQARPAPGPAFGSRHKLNKYNGYGSVPDAPP